MGICYQGKTLKEAIDERDKLTHETGRFYGVERLELAEEDPAKFTRFQLRLVSTCIAARETARWVAASPASMGTGELVFMMALPEGDCVAASLGLIGHVCCAPYIIRSMAELRFDDNPEIREGDIFGCNDSYYGAPHANDCYTMVPIFYEGELIAWSVGINHIADVGTMVTGMTANVSPNVFTDGWAYPPIKTGENFKQHKWWELLWQRRTRMGSMNVLDDKMRVTGAVTLHDKILGIVREFGVDYFRRGLREILERERMQMVETIRAQVVPGTYKQLLFRPVRYKGVAGKLFPASDRDWLLHYPMEMELTPGCKVHFDFEGASSEAAFQGNAREPCVRMALALAWFPMIVHSVAVNTAMDYLQDLNCPPGSMLNPRNPFAATNASIQYMAAYCVAFQSCLSRAFFSRGYMEEYLMIENTMNAAGLSGVLGDGTTWACADFSFVGASNNAATPYADAQVCLLAAVNPQSDLGEVEIWEAFKPTQLTLGKNTVPNLCVHGKFRGGLGVNLCELVYDPGQYLTISTLVGTPAETGIFALGQGGGYPGLGQFTYIVHDTNIRKLLEQGEPYPTNFLEVKQWLKEGKLKAGKVELYRGETPNIECKDGDLLIASALTTAAWGDPLDRDLSLVERDVHYGWLTPDVVSKIYGAVTDEGGRVKAKDSEGLRRKLRLKRKERAVAAKEWWKKEREQVLKKDFSEDVYNMYADSLKYEKFHREFTGMWQLPEDYHL
jgi:acetone carboxylase alpha subunit